MPGTPGPRHMGGDPHASDAHAPCSRDTPYADAIGLPIGAGVPDFGLGVGAGRQHGARHGVRVTDIQGETQRV